MLHHKLLLNMIIILSMIYSIQCAKKKDFVPTHEWQRIDEDQAIPPGLHVRMDMANGGKWAKLMDDKDNVGSKSISAIQIKDTPSTESKSDDKKEKLDIKELKERMKKLKAEKIKDNTEEKGEKKKFRSMEEIRADLEDLQIKEESDFDVMNRVLSTATSYHQTTDARLTALEDLEYYVHQVDNANDFVKIQGFEKMIKLLKNKASKIREQAIHVIGTAAQGNPKVQVKAVELNIVEKLLELLIDDKQPYEVKKKCLFAISCLIRQFPHAQHIFANNRGFPTLFNFFNNEDPTSKLLIKSIQLISDIMKERLDVQSLTKSDDIIEEKKKQYNRFNITSILEDNNWCGKLASTLTNKQFDVKEKSVEAMRNSLDICRNKFNQKTTINHLKDFIRLQVAMNEWSERSTLDWQYLDADRLLQLATDGDELEKFYEIDLSRVDL